MAALTIANVAVFILCLCISLALIVPRIGQEFLSKCVGCISSVAISSLIAGRVLRGSIPSIQGKAVLVTCCDTGIGNALARHLDRLGFRVFAGCLFAKRPEALRLKEECSERLEVIQLDVTSDQQVSEAVASLESVLAATGDGKDDEDGWEVRFNPPPREN